MKELINLHFWEQHRREDSQHFNPSLFAECRERFPQFFENPNIMDVLVEKNDPILQQIIGFLRTHGREPYLKKYPSWVGIYYGHASIYQVEGKRVFEPADFAEAEYLAFAPEKVITQDAYKDYEGRLLIQRSKVNRQSIGRPFPSGNPVCRDHLKREMEAECFVGLVFERVAIVKSLPKKLRRPFSGLISEYYAPEEETAGDEPVWVMRSDREMPALLNRLVCEDGTDYEFAKALGCYVDDFYYPPLLRFPADQVRRMEPFDFAITKERPHHKRGPGFTGDPMKKYEPYVIVSRRFRHWCEKRKLKIEWWPVLLE